MTLALALIAAAPLTAAQAYPAKPVHIVVGFPPGGAADLMARLAAENLSTSFAKPLVVENRPAAGGTRPQGTS